MSYTRKAVRRSGLMLVFSVLASVVAYGTRIVLARGLGPEQYGLFTAVFTFVIFFLFFRDWGFDVSLVKHITDFLVAKKYDEIKTAIVSTYRFQFIISLLFALIFFFVASWLGEHYFKNPQAAFLLRVMCWYAVSSLLFLVLKNMFLAFQKSILYSSIDFAKNIMVLLIVGVGFYFGLGMWSAMWAYVLVGPILFVLYVLPLFRSFAFFKYKVLHEEKIFSQISLFAIPIFFSSVGGSVIASIDTLFLTYFRSLAEVGVYNVVLPTAMAFLFFSSALNSVLFPMVVELRAKNDLRRLKGGLKLAHRYTFLVILPVLLSLVVFGYDFLRLFFGEAYVSGTMAFQILLIGIIFYTVASINNMTITATGKPRQVTKIILISALINGGLNLLLIPRYGLVGAAWATFAGYLFVLWASTREVTKIFLIRFPVRDWLILAGLGVVFWASAMTMREMFILPVWLSVFIIVPLSLGLYFGLAYLFGVLDLKEIKYYGRLVRN